MLVQLSDSHLFTKSNGLLLGMNTRESLQRVIELVREQQPHVDLLLATGDLSQDGTLESYKQFLGMTKQIDAPARWIPGNHDKPQIMAKATVHSDLLDPVVDIGNWCVTLLDSTMPDLVPGFLQDQQLQLLIEALRESPSRHHLVCFHHHPVSIGCAWMDPIGLRNPEALFAVLDRFPQVKAVLWGHVHQEIDRERNGVRLLASPSTCIQFDPFSVNFKVSEQSPGYRWLLLHADGRLETGVERVKGFTFTVDYSDK